MHSPRLGGFGNVRPGSLRRMVDVSAGDALGVELELVPLGNPELVTLLPVVVDRWRW